MAPIVLRLKKNPYFQAYRLLLQFVCGVAVVAVLSLTVHAQGASIAASPRWITSWMMAPCEPAEAEPRNEQFQLHDETVREIVHLSIGGEGVRIKLSNVYGSTPLVLRSVHVARVVSKGNIDSQTDRSVTVGGASEIQIAPGKTVTTDPVKLAVPASSDLAVSFYVPNKVTAAAIHYTALQTSYIAKKDQSAAAALTSAIRTSIRVILTGVEVATNTSSGAIVAIGSSTTDGARSSYDANHRWTDYLFNRFYAERKDAAPAVLNAGIAGNRVTHDGRGSWGPVWGRSALSRFPRDVFEQTGVRYVIFYEGGNDIHQPGSGAVPLEEAVTSQQLIHAFQVAVAASHERGIKVIVGTITPFEHSDLHRIENPMWEKTRQEFNAWVRSSHEIDGVADFDEAIRDPAHPARILAAYDSGDHLHPNDAGYKAMADTIPLSLFH